MRHHWLRIGLVLIVATCSIMAIPSSVSAGTVAVGSEHTTTSDFVNGSISGDFSATDDTVTGTAATLAADDFDDGNIDGWAGGGRHETGTVESGSGSLAIDGDDAVRKDFAVSQNKIEVSVSVYSEWVSEYEDLLRFYDGVNYFDIKGFNGNELEINGERQGTTLSTNAWHDVRILFNSDQNTAEVLINGNNYGTFEYQHSPVNEIEYDTAFDTASDYSTYVDSIEFKQPFDSGSYTSATHSVDGANTGIVDISTVTDATADIDWQANDGDGWTTVDSQSVSTAGTYTSDLSTSSATDYRVVVNGTPDGDQPELTLTRDAVEFESATPTISDPGPGNETVYDSPVTLEATVDDADLGTAQGDSLTLEWVHDGKTIGTETVSEAGTYNQTVNNPVAGENSWQLTVSDEYGNSETVSQSFRAPEELEIRDEQNPDTLITNPGSAEVRFYTDSDQVYTRSPDNATISLAGLPADETFVAAVSVDGYNTRTITIDSLLEQQTAYLLDENATVAEVDFELNDQTNQFPTEQTTLFVQRAITRNNSTAWRTIVGERFGATGTVPTTLAAGDRYRLKVRNQDGDMRALGSYVAAGAAIEPLRIGQVTFQGAQDSGASFSSRFDSTSESEAVDLRYVDPAGSTDELNVTVRRQDANNTVVFEDSISGPIDTYRERIPTSALPGHTDDSSYKVEYSAARSGAAVPISGNRTIGDVPSVATDWPIDAQFLNIAGYLTILALFGAMVILSPRHAGLVGSATAFALSIIGVIAINSLVLSFALVVSGLFAVGGES